MTNKQNSPIHEINTKSFSLIEKIGIYFGIFVAVVTIVAFFTGKASIPDIFPKRSDFIKGTWDLSKAETIVYKYLTHSKNIKQLYLSGEITHEIINAYYVQYIDNCAFIVISASNTEENKCHACAPELSFFEFVKTVKNDWELRSYSIYALSYGQWGEVSKDELIVLPIGYNIYGIKTEGCGLNQGIITCSSHIYSNIGGEYKDIFWEITSEDYSNNSIGTNWTSELQFIKTGTGYYDINLIKSNDQGIIESILLKFDGIKYSQSNIYK